MALFHPVLGLPIQWRTLRNGELPVRRRFLALAGVASLGERRVLRDPTPEGKPRHGPTEIAGQGKLKVFDAPALEMGQIRGGVEILVTCFQLLGVTVQSEKDEIVKAVIELKSSTIEDGYTADTIASRQDLLMDVRDKLLFEPEYAGNVKEKVSPKSSLRIPWPWLTGALCLLQEVGEEKLVLEIGRAALQLPSAKAYSHDLLLSMALAECSLAKVAFEKNKVSEGFEALARAQYLLRSNIYLAKMPLLSQIEESLEDLAPACTLELLSLPNAPDSAERRRGALAALQELIRQGLDVEPSCRVEDWSYFLVQAMNKLTATEVIDLLSWDTLAVTRKNKKSIESQNQRVVLDFNCFYLAMIAHIALGFSTRQNEMITRAKNICECLIISEGADLKLEEVFCSFLLGKHGGMEDIEKLRQLVATRNSTAQNQLSMGGMDKNKDKGYANHALETWLKDAVLCLFTDTRDCSPSLANFFGSSKRILSVGNQKILTKKAVPSAGHPVSYFGVFPDRGTCGQAAPVHSSNNLGEAVKQLAPVNMQSENEVGKITDNTSLPCSQLKRNLDSHHKRLWESWFVKGDMAGTIAYATLVGCLLFGSFKLLHALQFGLPKTPRQLKSSHSRITREADAVSCTAGRYSTSGSFDRDVMGQLRKFWVIFKQNLEHKNNDGNLQKTWPTEDLSPLHSAADNLIHKEQMATEEAASLVMHWQDIKAEALGPEHQIQLLPSILSESMLLKWQDLANSAKARSCFWRFVLIQTSILRAEIVSDGGDSEMAEIEAVLKEAAELVDGSEPNNLSYYSTYKVNYILRRQEDGSWRICRGSIENQT